MPRGVLLSTAEPYQKVDVQMIESTVQRISKHLYFDIIKKRRDALSYTCERFTTIALLKILSYVPSITLNIMLLRKFHPFHRDETSIPSIQNHVVYALKLFLRTQICSYSVLESYKEKLRMSCC